MRELVLLGVTMLVGCGAFQRGEGLDVATVPVALRGDYELFAQRCSRCHSISRPLNARITSEGHWSEYVTRMRRMPGSGIAPDDVAGLLRFLNWYSLSRLAPDASVGVVR